MKDDKWKAIFRFLDFDMSEREEQAFNDRLQKDRELHDDFAVAEAVNDALDWQRTQQVKAEIKSLQAAAKRRRLLVAISVFALVIATVGWYVLSSGGGEEERAPESFKNAVLALEDVPIEFRSTDERAKTRGVDSSATDGARRKLGYAYYNQREYQKARSAFLNLMNMPMHEQEARWMYVLSGTLQNEEALDSMTLAELDKLRNNPTSAFQEKAVSLYQILVEWGRISEEN